MSKSEINDKENEIQKFDSLFGSNPILKNITPEQKAEILNATLQVISINESYTHSGPLPPVDTLKGYNDIIPQGGERLMKQVEIQGEHRRKIESSVVNWNNLQSLIGQFFGLIIAGGVLYFSYLLAMNNHDTVAGILGGATVVSLAGIFVYGRKKQK